MSKLQAPLDPVARVLLINQVDVMERQLESLEAWADTTRRLLLSPACANALGAREGGDPDATVAVRFAAPLEDLTRLLDTVQRNLQVELGEESEEDYRDLSMTWEELEGGDDEEEGADAPQGAAAPTLDPARAIGVGMTLGLTPGLTPGLEVLEVLEAREVRA
ncbi:hypothetical protein [Megalodesulfovibrio paquesii]